MKRTLCLLALAACADAIGDPPAPGPVAVKALARPLDRSGTSDGANYKIRVPESWNRTLLVFAHGYRPRALYPGETDDTHADAAYRGAAMEDYLLGLGYAVAGSAYKSNGWAVEDGIEGSRALVERFRAEVGAPDRTILWGFSLGSVVTLTSAERYADSYDGFIAGCVVAAGTPRTFDRALDYSLAYKVAFGWPARWGTPGDLGGQADFAHEMLPDLLASLSGAKTDDRTFGLLEFIRLVNHGPFNGYYVPVLRDGYNFSTPAVLFDLFYATEARAELERRAGGSPAQNANHQYGLTPLERLYLRGLGVDAEALLDRMNGERVYHANPAARAYAKRWSQFTGRVAAPVLTLESVDDDLTSADGLSALQDTYARAGTSSELVETFVTGAGHCNFTNEQVGTAVAAMVGWIDGGIRPEPGAFPALLGFVPGFVPPRWPQPGLPDDDE